MEKLDLHNQKVNFQKKVCQIFVCFGSMRGKGSSKPRMLREYGRLSNSSMYLGLPRDANRRAPLQNNAAQEDSRKQQEFS